MNGRGVLALQRLRGLAPGGLQHLALHHLHVVAVRPRAGMEVGDVIAGGILEERPEDPIDQRRVEEWLVRGNLRDRVAVGGAQGRDVPVEEVRGVAAHAGDAGLLREIRHRIIRAGSGGGDDDLPRAFAPPGVVPASGPAAACRRAASAPSREGEWSPCAPERRPEPSRCSSGKDEKSRGAFYPTGRFAAAKPCGKGGLAEGRVARCSGARGRSSRDDGADRRPCTARAAANFAPVTRWHRAELAGDVSES